MDLTISSIEKIEVGMQVIYKEKQYTVYNNTGETVYLQPKIGRNLKIPFYNCNNIQRLDGSYF